MARPESFIRAQVLDKAMLLFWNKGFRATSVDDLVTATALNRSSLYNSFGNKETLFLQAIDHYLEHVSRKRSRLLQQPGSARVALRNYFEDLLTFSVNEGRKLGCLLTNTAVELAPHHDELESKVAQSFLAVEGIFEELLVRGVAQGEFELTRHPRAHARFLVNTVQGLRIMARINAPEDHLRDIIETAIAGLS